jgi:hypothetical protein
MLRNKVVEKMQTNISCSKDFSENRAVCGKKYSRNKQATDDYTIWRMRSGCYIIKATNTQHV